MSKPQCCALLQGNALPIRYWTALDKLRFIVLG